MNIKKILRFDIRDVYGNLKEVRQYTLLPGDFVLVKWSDSGSPYWSTRERYESEKSRDVNSKIVDTGSIYVEETGGYFRDEKEFIETMKLSRGVLIK